ncbi:MAG: c-type cytochrome [Thermoanaerobaculia bacterium]
MNCRATRAACGAVFLLPLVLGLGACAPANPGEQVWVKKCAGCHGSDGRGETKFAQGRPFANLTDDRWKHGDSHEAIVRLITEGDEKSPMPAYRDRLTAEQIEAVSRYAESLSRAARQARKSVP